jgi:hypothetical protein
MDPPCRDLTCWLAQSTGPSRYLGGIVRVSMLASPAADDNRQPTPRPVEEAFSFLGPPSRGQQRNGDDGLSI